PHRLAITTAEASAHHAAGGTGCADRFDQPSRSAPAMRCFSRGLYKDSETMQPERNDSEKTIRCAVFTTIEAARVAVGRLLDAGFTQDQISVLCSDESKERHFR